MISSIFRPPRTPPRALTSSAPILAPRTMNCPAAASPGGESGVSTPIFTGFWASAGEVSPTTRSVASRANRTRPVIVLLHVLRGAGCGAERPSCYARRAAGVNTTRSRVKDVDRVTQIERLASPIGYCRLRMQDQSILFVPRAHRRNRIRRHGGWQRHVVNDPPIGLLELKSAVRLALDLVALL